MKNMEHRAFQRNMLWVFLGAAALMIIAAITLLLPSSSTAPAELPPARAADSAGDVRVQEGCELYQTLTYTRCDHVVTRRVTAPVELLGKNRDDVAALYPEWRITQFGPKLIKMEQQPDLFCPDHKVLMPGGDGMLCVFENKYGDALALVKELDLPLTALPAAGQEDVEQGMGFSTLEELEQWLENMES